MRQLEDAFGDLVTAGVIAFPLIALIWWALSSWRGRVTDYRIAMATTSLDLGLALAVLAVLYLVAVPIYGVPDGKANLAPGADITAGLSGRESMWQLVGNVLLLSPLGALAPVRLRVLGRYGRVALSAAALSVLIELAQFTLAIGRVSTTDDVLLNTVGALLGAVVTQRWWRGNVVRPRGRHAVRELGRQGRHRWIPSSA